MLILVIRHGLKDESVRDTATDFDMELTDQGKKNSLQIGKEIRKITDQYQEITSDKIRIITSPYPRVLQTLNAALSTAGDVFNKSDNVKSEALGERIKGVRGGRDTIGMTMEQIREKYPKEMAEVDRLTDSGKTFDTRLPEGETPREHKDRISNDVRELVEQAEQDSIELLLLFTHDGTGRIAMMVIAELEDEFYEYSESLPMGSISVIEGSLADGFSTPQFIYKPDYVKESKEAQQEVAA